MFVRSLFPDKFKKIVTQCFIDSSESYFFRSHKFHHLDHFVFFFCYPFSSTSPSPEKVSVWSMGMSNSLVAFQTSRSSAFRFLRIATHTNQPQELVLLGLSSFRSLTTSQPSLPHCRRTPYHAPRRGLWAGTPSAPPRSAFGR